MHNSTVKVSPFRSLRMAIYLIGIVFLTCLLIALFLESRHQDLGRVLHREFLRDGGYSVDFISAPYKLDKIYTSMLGPSSALSGIKLSERAPQDETLFLTGLESTVVDARTLAPVSPEYFCHANLTLSPRSTTPEKHNASFNPPTHSSWRMFTLVPGRMAIHLPDGFGIPLKSSTELDYFTMALNQNPGTPPHHVRVRTNLYYRRHKAGRGQLKPLFLRPIYVYQQHKEKSETGNLVALSAPGSHAGETCADSCETDRRSATPSIFTKLDPHLVHPGATCCVVNASEEGIVPQFGPENTAHWMVPPGRHLYRTEVTKQLELPFETMAHYVTGHLHPFGRSLKLIDMETGETVFEILGEDYSDRLGVKSMSEISIPQGVAIRRDHRYELIAEYNNTTDRPVDAMAILYLFMADQLR